MGRNPFVPAIAVVVLIVAMVFVVRHFMAGDQPPRGRVNWYDMKTGELYGGFETEEAGLPPITLPSGNEGVIARV